MQRSTAILGFFAVQFVLTASPPKAAPSAAPPPKLLHEIHLPPPAESVGMLAFSPDEHWIAVVAGPRQSELLLLPLNGSPDQNIHIDPGAPIACGPVWSPNSDAVLVGEFAGKQGIAKLYSIRGTQLWEHDGLRVELFSYNPAGGVFGFLDPEHLLARESPKDGKAGFETLDLEGHVIDTWPAPKQWELAALNPNRHLLAVFADHIQSKTLVIDYPSKKMLQTRSNPTWLYQDGGRSAGVWQYFAEGGKTLCSVGSAESRPAGAECWDADSGAKIAEFQRFTGGIPAAASACGSRLVLTEETRFWSKRRSEIDSYGERVVWDFRSGAELAAWQTTGQAVVTHGTSAVIRPTPVAISSTGHYVAEGGGGILRIYELP
jgi:hypothetical protein